MSKPAYGQYQVPEPFSAFAQLHHHPGGLLVPSSHEPPVGVLDQSDLIAQGIDVASFIPGAARSVDSLGSCTANATTAALSNILPQADFFRATDVSTYADVKGAEEFAIRFYHECTDQTGVPSQEWPPTDCGSSGQYIVSECRAQKLASGDRTATTMTDIVSLLQTDGVLLGSPFFYAWEEPAANGFIDNKGIEAAVRSGVAGGHETYWWGVETLALEPNGTVNADKTVIIGRNSWGGAWGDAGNYRARLSTFQAIAHYCDWRQLVAA
jgi:hypothetical protein